MKLETKYEVGQHIWIIYENRGEVCIYDDYIGWITYEDELRYATKETYTEVIEEDIILYEDTDKLINRIKELMQEIREKEGKEE